MTVTPESLQKSCTRHEVSAGGGLTAAEQASREQVRLAAELIELCREETR